MRGFRWIAFLSAALACAPALAADDPKAITDAFMQGFVSGDTGPAFDGLMAHSRIDEMKPREIALAKFVYYKPNGPWTLLNFNFNDQLDQLD